MLPYDGERFWAGPTSEEEYAAIVAAGGRRAGIYRALRELSESCTGQIRERYPQIPRRVSGYNLDSLLPEQGFDVGRALVGSESTLVTVLHAELRLVLSLRPRRWSCWGTRTSPAPPTPPRPSPGISLSSCRAWTAG